MFHFSRTAYSRSSCHRRCPAESVDLFEIGATDRSWTSSYQSMQWSRLKMIITKEDEGKYTNLFFPSLHTMTQFSNRKMCAGSHLLDGKMIIFWSLRLWGCLSIYIFTHFLLLTPHDTKQTEAVASLACTSDIKKNNFSAPSSSGWLQNKEHIKNNSIHCWLTMIHLTNRRNIFLPSRSQV